METTATVLSLLLYISQKVFWIILKGYYKQLYEKTKDNDKDYAKVKIKEAWMY